MDDCELREDSYIFTFGSGHFTEAGLCLANFYLELHGSFEETQRMMYKARGGKWAFQYQSKGSAGVFEFGLQPITLDEVRLPETSGGDIV